MGRLSRFKPVYISEGSGEIICGVQGKTGMDFYPAKIVARLILLKTGFG